MWNLGNGVHESDCARSQCDESTRARRMTARTHGGDGNVVAARLPHHMIATLFVRGMHPYVTVADERRTVQACVVLCRRWQHVHGPSECRLHPFVVNPLLHWS